MKIVKLISILLVLISYSLSEEVKNTKSDPTKEYITNLDEAKGLARRYGRHLLLIAIATDINEESKNLKATILEDDNFQKWLFSEYVAVILDYPKENTDKALIDISRDYQLTGFPTAIILDEYDKEIGRTDWNEGSYNKFIANLKRLEYMAKHKTD